MQEEEGIMTKEHSIDDNTMINYVGTRGSTYTMTATITRDSEEFATIETATFASKGSIMITEGEVLYQISKRKPYRGFVVEDSDTNEMVARAWRDGILTKSLYIIVDNVYYRMDSKSSFTNNFEYYKVCTIDFPVHTAEKQVICELMQKEKYNQGTKVGTVYKDGLFKSTYSLAFQNDVPKVLPPLALWLSTLFERQDSAVVAGSSSGSFAGVF